MPSISVVICTYNEERNIERCLNSVATFADEIIVVDSHSTDATQEICRKFDKLNFVSAQWQGYSKTKNYANSLATSDYILSLDADEELSEETRSHLNAIKPELKGAYQFNRKTNYCGKWINHSEWFPDWCCRLFPAKSAKWNDSQVHEQLEWLTETDISELKGIVHHYSYYSLSEHLQRIDKYSELGAEDVLRKYGKSKTLLLRAVLNGSFRIFRIYVLKKGFLDGAEGLLIAIISGFAVFLKYAKAWQKAHRSL